ncbi:unnamed protein product [Closterium sp. Naga37s-1]|nr:unnamed protein product [Closterium sp. Naga37s-1]
MVAREQTTEVQEGACNGMTVQEDACNGMTVQDGACNGMTVQEDTCNGLTVQDGAFNEVTAQEGSAIAGGAGAEGTLFRALEAEEVRRQGHRMVEFIADYLQGVGDRPVCSTVQHAAGLVACGYQQLSAHQTHSFSCTPSLSCNASHCTPCSAPANHTAHALPCMRGPTVAPSRHHDSPAICGLCCPPTPPTMANHWTPFSQVMRAPSRPHPCAVALAPPVCIPPSSFEPPCPPPSLAACPYPPTDISSAILPGIMHWQSPAFFAFFSSPTSAAAICADALNVVGFSWAAAPAATELEEVVMDWMVDLLGLPDGFHSVKSGGQGGEVIHGTASEALLVALLAARRRVLDRVVGPAGSMEEAAADSAAAVACRQGAQEKKRAAEGRLIAHLNEAESRLIWRIVSARNGRQRCNGSVGVTHEEWLVDAAGDGDGDGSGACVIGTTSSTGAGAGQAGSISGGAAAASKAAAGACEQGEAAGAPWGSAEDRAAQCQVAYVSDQTHACALKACRVAGMPESNVRVLPTTAASAYALTPRQLLDAVQRDEAAGLIPFFLVLTVSGRCLVASFFPTLTGS